MMDFSVHSVTGAMLGVPTDSFCRTEFAALFCTRSPSSGWQAEVMTYTGQVTPNGPSEVRELPDAVIRKASVSPQDNNSYLITCRSTGRQLLVDAADNAPRVSA